MQVYDYDWGLRDDFIGEASVDLRKLPENLAQDLLLTLCDSGGLNHTFSGQAVARQEA